MYIYMIYKILAHLRVIFCMIKNNSKATLHEVIKKS